CMEKESSVQSARRVLAIIEALNHSRVTPLEVLHATTGLPKSTLVRLLETLIEEGYVARVSRREGYALTEAVLRLSAGMRHRDVLVDVARPLMEAFTQEHRWQVSLATSENSWMVVRFTTRHLSPFAREEIFLNRRVVMLKSAIGRAYMGFCSGEEQEFILRLIEDRDPDEVADAGGRERMAAVLRRVRRDGYATIVRPPDDPSRSFAIPILDHDRPDRPLGSIVLFYYRSVMTEAEAVARYLPALRELAAAIAEGLAGALQAGPPPATALARG
ncbi:MAG: helix-turn-helix domain-containing protein, partial [Proteobacteria bacterium]|nr:helix-turn-helix domain-containing protein [Pseudomonadota bacterium]